MIIIGGDKGFPAFFFPDILLCRPQPYDKMRIASPKPPVNGKEQ